MTRHRHQLREAKAARRRARIGSRTRGKVRGPVTRAQARATAMNEGETRLLRMSARVGEYLDGRGVRQRQRQGAKTA